jgi:hypothetical protein
MRPLNSNPRTTTTITKDISAEFSAGDGWVLLSLSTLLPGWWEEWKLTDFSFPCTKPLLCPLDDLEEQQQRV